MNVFLNSYIPLCASVKGRVSSTKHKIPPFVDGSCRREPDFEKERLAITGLCRTDKLINRLNVGDLVIYVTNKRRYFNKYSERFYVGILEVEHIYPSHKDAMDWYINNGHQISQNIICEATEALESEYTHRLTEYKLNDGEVNIKRWDAGYRYRSRRFPKVARCRIWSNQLNLYKPKAISDNQLRSIFNRIPGTQNPPTLKHIEWQNFKKVILNQ